jgi:hypothetical protein
LRACAFDEMAGICAATFTAGRPGGRGVNVAAATDVSAAMIRIASRKARAGNCQERLGQGPSMLAAVSDHFIAEAIRLP